MNDQIYLGDAIELDDKTLQVKSRKPFSIPRSLLGHAHIRGRTRQGKTSLTLISWIPQLLKPYLARGVTQRSMLAIIDLKGDANLFHNAKAAAKAEGRVFKYLVIDAVPDLDSFHFPPFQFWSNAAENVLAATETTAQAFGQDFGMVYGANYYLQQNIGSLLAVYEHFAANGQEPTFERIAALLGSSKAKREFKDADQMRLTFSMLAKYRQLVEHSSPERNIDVRKAIEEGHVLYIWCRTLRQALSARFIAGLALYTIIALAMERSTLGGAPRHCYVAIDEFQELVSHSIGALMAQSGAWLSLILLNQSTSQLKNRDLSMADFVFENAAVKQYFTCVGEDDIRSLQALSNDKRIILGGGTARGLASSQSYREMIVPSLDADVIRDVSASFGRSFFVIDDGRGHADPIIVEQTHRYPDLSQKPMPRRAADDTDRDRAAAVSATPPTPAAAHWQPALAALWEEKQAAEVWEMVG